MNEYKPDIIMEKFVKGLYGESYIATPILKTIYSKKSRYQEILIAETPFGKALFLDRVLQLTEYDEETFHRALVLPGLKKAYRKILILGGGDGGTARELRRALPKAEITIVDIDREVTEAVSKYLPFVPKGVFEDPKTKLINMDAFEYIERTKEKFDYIIGDLTDLREEGVEGSQVNRLYTIEALSRLRELLTDDGRVVYHLELYPAAYNLIKKFIENVKEAFNNHRLYATYIPSFGGFWCYIIMSNKPFRIKRKIGGLLYPDKILVIKNI